MKKIITLQFTLLVATILVGNNIQISNCALVEANAAENYVMVQFDLSWENSWRTTSAPYNFDAAWIFIKYKKTTDVDVQWGHATLGQDGNSIPSGFDFYIGETDGINKGIFIYRDTDNTGSGTVSLTDIKLRWDYGEDGLPDNEEVDFNVFGIEMVFIPEGSFSVGDGTSNNVRGQLHRANNESVPFPITSEGAITLGGTSYNNMGNNNTDGMWVVDDFNSTTTKTLDAGFPKGYRAFAIMKHSITQQAYVDFLNSISRNQQNTRTTTDLSSPITNVSNRFVMSGGQIMVDRNGIRCDATIPANVPVTFYCDYNSNGIGGENGDGQHIACNWINWADVSAFLDWAALRPITELEFEKACRGDQTPVADEYAWGNTQLDNVNYILANPGMANEYISNPSTGNTGNALHIDSPITPEGPARVGIFATGSSSRPNAGASYYGVMGLSGNVWKRVISIGNQTGRNFTGQHGDGNLSSAGNSNQNYWPGTNAIGSGGRGGCYLYETASLRVSSRTDAAHAYIERHGAVGGCGGRTIFDD